jgi:multidrug efflux pump
VLSISVSLVTVFAPILLMGGIVGRLFREFAVTISVAILVSLVVSLSTTPMMCARLLKREGDQKHGRIHKATGAAFDWILHKYDRSLRWVLRHQFIVLCILLVTVALNFYLFKIVPKGFFPQQDTGALTGVAQGSEDISFQSMSSKLLKFIDIVQADPAVAHLVGFTGGGGGTTTDQGRMFITLKPLSQRTNSADEIVARLRAKCARVAGATCIFALAAA